MPRACLQRCTAPSARRRRRRQSMTCGGSWVLPRRGRRPPPEDAGPGTRPGARATVFHPEFREDLRYWVATDRRIALRALDLVEAIVRDPFQGIGKPEPLKHLAAGVWSRRLTQEHRIVYLVAEDRIDFLQA